MQYVYIEYCTLLPQGVDKQSRVKSMHTGFAFILLHFFMLNFRGNEKAPLVNPPPGRNHYNWKLLANLKHNHRIQYSILS